MSNIVVYTTPSLENSSGFLNNFLDGLLEQYCSKHFVENSVIDWSISLPSLDDLICFAYPGYYYKAPGLYANKTHTDVKMIYEEALHSSLVEALDHKLRILFLTYSGSRIMDLSITILQSDNGRGMNRNFYNSPLKHPTAFDLTDYHAIRYYYDEELRKFSNVGTDLSYFIRKAFGTDYELVCKPRRFRLYKPKPELINQVIASHQKENEDHLEAMLNSFHTSSNRGVSFWLALSFVAKGNSAYSMISESVSEEFLKRMEIYSQRLLDTVLSHVIKSIVEHGNLLLRQSDPEDENRTSCTLTRIPEPPKPNPPTIITPPECPPVFAIIIIIIFISALYLIFGGS